MNYEGREVTHWHERPWFDGSVELELEHRERVYVSAHTFDTLMQQKQEPSTLVYHVWTNAEPVSQRYPATIWERLDDENGWQVWKIETASSTIETLLERDRCVMGYEQQEAQ